MNLARCMFAENEEIVFDHLGTWRQYKVIRFRIRGGKAETWAPGQKLQYRSWYCPNWSGMN